MRNGVIFFIKCIFAKCIFQHGLQMRIVQELDKGKHFAMDMNMEVDLPPASLKRGAAAFDGNQGGMPGLWTAAKKQMLEAPPYVAPPEQVDGAAILRMLQDRQDNIRKRYNSGRHAWIAQMVRANALMTTNTQAGSAARAQQG